MAKPTAAEKKAIAAAAEIAANEAIEAQVANEATEETNEEAEERTAGQKMADTLRRHRAGYGATIAYSGKSSLSNGDSTAKLLGGATPEEAIALAQALLDQSDRPSVDLAAKYNKLNKGQQRMNAGNRVRGGVKRGDWTDAEVAEIFAKLS